MNRPPSLDQLRDIHLPAAAPDALLGATAATALALGAVIAGLAAYAVWRRRARRRPLRDALRQLDALAREHARTADDSAFARGVSRLLRAYVAGRFPRTPAAALAGAAWLDFLDAHGGGGAFARGAGRPLASLPYAPPGRGDASLDAPALTELVRTWLRRNAP